MLRHGRPGRVRPRPVTLVLVWMLVMEAFAALPSGRRRFDVPAGGAESTLRLFAAQADVELVYTIERIEGVRTNPIKGELPVREALDRMVANTGLVVVKDERTGALMVSRGPGSEVRPEPPARGNRSSPPSTYPANPPNMKRTNPIALLGAWLGLAAAPVSPALAAEAATGTIEGRVLNARSGEYLEKARVTLEGTAREAFTDSAGQFRITQVPAGPARVRIFFTGLNPVVETITVTAGESVSREFTLGGERGDVVRLSEFVVGASREMDGAAIAINEQRFAPNITNVVSAGEFGISADGSVGEFLKFLPGISINYVGGTANTLSMDGVPSNNVPVTVGGFDLASTSSASTSRSSELLQISIHNAARIEVLHSPTSESPGSALAGSINMVPRSAFERSRPLFTGSVYLMMRDNDRSFSKSAGPRKYATRKVQPGFDFSYIRPVNQRLGFTLSGSFSRQYLPQDTITQTWRGVGAATTGLTAATAGTQYPDTTPDRPYLTDFVVSDITKFNDRTSFGATVDYKLSHNDNVSFSYQYGQFGSEFNNNGITFLVNRVDPGNFTPTSTRGVVGRGEIRNANSSRWRDGETHMPTLVYRHMGPVWRAEAGAGYSHSTNLLRDTSRGYFGSVTSRRTGVTVSYDDIFYLRPRTITVTDGATGAPVDPFNLSSYVLSSVGSPQPRDSIDVKRSAYANLRREFDLRGVPLTLKGGVDFRHAVRDMRGSTATWNYVGADGRATTTPTDAAGSDDGVAALIDEPFSQRVMPYGFPKSQWISADKAWDLFQAQPGWFRGDANAEYRGAVSLSKRAEELVSSGYVRGDLALFERRLKLVGGVRVEQTNVEAEGPLTDPTRNFQRDSAGRFILGANGRPLPIVTDALGTSQRTFLDRGMKAEKEYLRIFPNLNASLNLRENLVARASIYTSVGRPDYNQYAGGVTLPDTELAPSTTNRITVNNVAIKAWSAQTIKARLEYYFEGVGQISVGGFRREFENFFGGVVFAPTPEFLTLYDLDPEVYGGYEVSTQHNLTSKVRMTGFEFDYKQVLRFLPHWARGVQVFANLSALRTTGDAAANFAGYVPRTYNWGVSLNRERYNVRMNWNYQGRRRLGQVAAGRSIEPGTFNWRSKRMNVDLQGEFYLRKNFAVFANFRNLRNATEDFEISGPSTPEHAQFRSREDYGASWTFGVKGSF